ncbi:ATP-binding protein [Puerhibacterium puerhi]|uniref:ATP-binding protein n=1 Tax=Puerhibacterium puerhi TaxID=2692623 RepID=UPI00135AEF03|nr:ATP-binding protein [Puerhibacterium puerhi]
MTDVLDALAAAVAAAPDSAPLRVHYGSLLHDAGRHVEAVEQASAALRLVPTDGDALALLTRATTALQAAAVPTEAPTEAPAGPTEVVEQAIEQVAEQVADEVVEDLAEPLEPFATVEPLDAPDTVEGAAVEAADQADVETDVETDTEADIEASVDWKALEAEVGIDVPPPFVAPERADDAPLVPARDDEPGDGADLLDVAHETVTLDDVGGLEPVKQRIREAFLEPMRNPAIAKAFGKSLRGGLLLYGPPGTGKTFLARAVAGELGARFLTVTLADILDRYLGESEQNLHALFQRARQLAPAVLFLDEVDAIGGKRSQYSGSGGMRTVVNQLLQEMDGMGADNDGLFVLGATNHPWDVDTALLRPGRFDRVVLVLPPDAPAREAILRHHLRGRPLAGIDLGELVDRTDGFSGADLEHLAASAAEKAMMDSIATGEVRAITMDDLRAALREVRPSTTAWLQSARNVVQFANNDGRYDDLAAYLRSRRML